MAPQQNPPEPVQHADACSQVKGSDIPDSELQAQKVEEPLKGTEKGEKGEGGGEKERGEDTPGGSVKKGGKEKPPRVPFHRLFSYAEPLDIVLMVLGSLGAMVHGAALPVFFLFFGKLTNSLGVGDVSSVPQYCLYFVYLGIVIQIAGWLNVSCWMQAGERQSARIRVEYLRAVLRQDVAYFDKQGSSGEVVSRVSSDVHLIQDAISEKVGNFLHYVAQFVGGFAVGFVNVWQLALVTLAVMPLLVVSGAVYTVVLTGLSSKSQQAYADAGKLAEQAIGQVRTVYSYVAEERTAEEYSKALGKSLKLGIQGGLSKGLGMGTTFGVLLLAWALLFWYANLLITWGFTNGGDALATMFAVLIGGLALGQAMPNMQAFAKGQAAAHSVFSTIMRQPDIRIEDPSGDTPALCQGLIELHNVCFSYPARPDAPIFSGFSIRIDPGESVALVGASGSGKSTVVALVQRFYDPQGGGVSLDGRDIRSLNLRWLRSRMGLVQQEPVLFATTIRENIRYGDSCATDADVEEAAKAANAHSFILTLPQGYDTQVGERGTQMSGGQKQRIAIARALVRRPAVLLLDEATSALDAESERVVQQALERASQSRTTLIVAHRLSTVRHASRIAVLSHGQVVESGTHEELMGIENGEYAALVSVQAKACDQHGTGAHAPPHSPLSPSGIDMQSSTVSEGVMSEYSGKGEGKTQEGEGGEEDKGEVKRGLWWRLFAMSLPEAHWSLFGLIGAAVSGAGNPILGLFLIEIVAAYYNPEESERSAEVGKWCLMFVALAVVATVAYTVNYFFFGIVGEQLVKRVRLSMFRAILRNEVWWFDSRTNSVGAVASRLSSDATLLKAALVDRVSVITQNLSLLLVAFSISFALSPRMAAVTLATFPVLVVASYVEQVFLRGFAGDQASAHEGASRVASEAVSNMRTVAAFSLEHHLLSLFSLHLQPPLRRCALRGHVAGLLFGFTQFAMYSSFGLALWYGSSLVPQYCTFDQVLKVFMILVMTSVAVAETLSLAPDLAKGGAAMASVFKVLDRVPEMDPDDPKGELAEGGEIRGEIEFKHVRFAYPTRPDVTLFTDLSLQVPVGKTLALVGPSGSGKSSVVALVERFYDPQGGSVLIDSKDVKQYNLRALRRHIGLVSQEPALFATTIRENILFGNPGASEAEVVEAARAANAMTFVSSLPQGLGTQVGERGTQLSGGQKQRIAIARAVLKSPAILLLDEATSALDAESEKVVQEALDTLMVGRTTIVIAHRLSTIRNVDLIAVVQDGKIVERGCHVSLMANPSGAYQSLVRLQQRNPSVQI